MDIADNLFDRVQCFVEVGDLALEDNNLLVQSSFHCFVGCVVLFVNKFADVSVNLADMFDYALDMINILSQNLVESDNLFVCDVFVCDVADLHVRNMVDVFEMFDNLVEFGDVVSCDGYLVLEVCLLGDVGAVADISQQLLDHLFERSDMLDVFVDLSGVVRNHAV